MGLTGEEIRHNLQVFAARWDSYKGSERAEAQTFLNQLFECYGQDRREVGARFEEPQKGKFLDLVWPGTCIFEMKRPSEAKKLARHRKQALDYWAASDDRDQRIARPRFMVLCAFSKLEIWEPGSYSKPVATIDLIDLANRYDALLFLAGDEPHFETDQSAVTREAVALVSDLYTRLRERRAAESEVLRNFILQSVWCMFAEDLGQIDAHRFTQLLEALHGDRRRSSKDELGRMFEYLNTPESEERHGMYAGTPYANGGLFRNPAKLHLEVDEIELLLKAAKDYQWNQVQPTIFGSLLEGGLGADKQWHLGAHYTHEEDIQKIVQPTIVQPWTDRIENITKHAEAVAAQNDLLNYVVLDPACGSGNFLYVAYREMRAIEKRLREREQELRRRDGRKEQGALSLFFPLSNMKGIEIDGFAVALARVTLWMGHKLAVDALDLHEPTLPLTTLEGIVQDHSLRAKWPKANAIIGNPPFHGSQNLRREVGDAEVEWLQTEFGVGVKDYCVYWFRKAHDALDKGGRAGFVGTNSISQNRARSASLDYIVENGGVITNAVSTQDWPGEAAVDVSIVNWTKNPETAPLAVVLDGQEVSSINSSLTAGEALHGAVVLPANQKRCFQGPQPVGKGFLLDVDEAQALLASEGEKFRDVVRPYLVGKDITSNPGASPTRFVIDFAVRPLEEAMDYPAALAILRIRVKPERDKNKRKARRENWWLLGELVRGLRTAVAPLDRYISVNAVGKRIFFVWADKWICPSNKAYAIALEDDFAMGVLTSHINTAWTVAQSATLEDRIAYTPTSAFETFPWPQPSAKIRGEVGNIAHRLLQRRESICLDKLIGLTTLYNQMDEGAWGDLSKIHRELDEAVAVAYGWPKSAAHDPEESNRRLLALNRSIASGDVKYEPFSYIQMAAT